MQPTNLTDQSETIQGIADLEQPVRELTAEEADQVQGGRVATMGTLAAPPKEPAPLTVTMSDCLISS
jgi:hypothetical protein